MNDFHTETILVDILTEASGGFPVRCLRAIEAAAEIPTSLRKVRWLELMIRPVEEALKRIGPFSDNRRYFLAQDNGFRTVGSRHGAYALVEAVTRGTAARDAVASLTSAFATNAAAGFGVMALRGISVSESITFNSGIQLVPFESLPDSANKRALLDGERHLSEHSFPFVTSALIAPHTVSPLFRAITDGEPTNVAPLALQELLNEARLALTLAGPSLPLSAGYWFQFEDPVLAALGINGRFTQRGVAEPWRAGIDQGAFDSEDAKLLVNAFLALEGPLRGRLRLSLERFFQALGESPHGDRALDLAIALESLLVDSNSEVTFRLALRAALLAESSTSERARLRATITALYGVRSSLIHSGLVATVKVKGRGRMAAGEVVEEATDACGKILRAVLLRGSLPDWESLEVSP